jgi:aspartyl aminopeptidase
MPEYLAFVRKAMDENGIHYQTSEIGKVDQGGGGTSAYILGNYHIYVLDAGVPVLSMHSPMELVSKADVYEAYKAYKVFLRA